ncbi:MAG: response regulator transcription factor [Myxococcota bacterium]
MAQVLVVEDEPAIAESLAYALRREGHEVTWADSLAAARDHTARHDLVVLDLMLPDGSGFELLTSLRQRRPAPAVIILSSRDQEADRVAGLETGADDYITKPFSPREVVARVRAVLRRTLEGRSGEERDREAGSASASASPPGRVLGDALPIEVDPERRRATARGIRLELTKVEFDLLRHLVGSPGRVFTRGQLIESIWGDNFAITDRTVDSHVKALRRKLAVAGGDAQWIETVRGVGYRLREGAR